MKNHNYNFDEIVIVTPISEFGDYSVELKLVYGRNFALQFFEAGVWKNPKEDAEKFAHELKNHLLDIFEHTTDLKFNRKVYDAKKALFYLLNLLDEYAADGKTLQDMANRIKCQTEKEFKETLKSYGWSDSQSERELEAFYIYLKPSIK